MRMRSRPSRTSIQSAPAAPAAGSRWVGRLACGSAFAFAIALPVAPLVAACNKPAPAVTFDAAPAAAPTPVATTVLVPIEEDAGSVADANPPPLHHAAGGPALTANQAHAKQCCSALRTAAKTDPMLSAFAAQCDTVAMQMGPTKGGTAPELAFLKTLPKLPAMCQGL
jgi:hypothetical protein